LLRYGIIAVAIVGCLGVFRIETASFAALLAAGGLAIGLAFQGTLSNFSAGVMMLILRPFNVDDFVNVAGQSGKVIAIDLFTTELATPDNRKVVIPNNQVFSAVIDNYTHHDTRRVNIDVGVEYSADIDQTREVLEKVPAMVEGVIDDPAPQIFLSGLGASSVDWVVRVWCKTDDYWDVHQATIRATKKVLDEAGLGIPFPQQDVHFDREVVEAFKKRQG
jgi:small conductance mechanosensitive channel